MLYCYDTLLENVSDPSLIDFSHHKVSKKERYTPSFCRFKVESSGSWGLAGNLMMGTHGISAEFSHTLFYYMKK
ncbi:pheophorbide a oxygenase [Populus alba x Populus x berolinensis]|uniref:Pheophorbide a oxygenase n=1 Tax=Populus alba x Populus x berolinensis TaxID=444605 RepID=A0AAD6MEW6_9ROSI|nr:pheophorbide a oxygenase [Populus alba x Populus x berolinensis]